MDFEFDIAGILYRSESAQDEAYSLRIGDTVNLKRDRNNEYDDYAIKIISNGKHIGFVPQLWSEDVCEYLDQKLKYTAEVIDTNTQNINLHSIDITIRVDFDEDSIPVLRRRNLLKDKKVLLCGKFRNTSEKDLNAKIWKQKGTITKKLTYKVDILVFGENYPDMEYIRTAEEMNLLHERILIIKESDFVDKYIL